MVTREPPKLNSRTALLMIDVQESFRHQPYFSNEGLDDFFAHSQLLVDHFSLCRLPVIRVLHVEQEGAFALGSGLVEPMREILAQPDVTFHKQFHSALAGTGLGAWLTSRGISRLVVSGIRTEQCCETTTRQASDLGFEVDYVTEATLTFPMTNRSGKYFTTADIRERTELVLHGRFATICTAEEAIARAGSL